MKLHLLEGRRAFGYTQFGSIWERGRVRGGSFCLRSADGRDIPLQSRPVAFWPDGSVKWMAHTADSGLMGKEAILTWSDLTHGENFQEENPCGNHTYKAEMTALSGKKEEVGCTETEAGWQFHSEKMSLFIPRQGRELFRNLTVQGECRAACAVLKLILERRSRTEHSASRTEYLGEGILSSVSLEDRGPLMWSFCFRGIHRLVQTGEEQIPFILRMRIYRDTCRLDIQHTFLYDGDENRDFLKGIGIELQCPLEGDTFDRHIRFGTDYGDFHEAASLMLVWDHKHPGSIYDAQIRGIPLAADRVTAAGGSPEDRDHGLPTDFFLSPDDLERLRRTASDSPLWDHYQLSQDSDLHFSIRKKTVEEEVCFLNALHGVRAKGTMAFGGAGGGVLAGLRDFWQKHPSGLELEGLSREIARATIWIYSPSAEAYDYRHYDRRAYVDTCYEGFPDYGATPCGVANTNDCSIDFCSEIIPSEDALRQFGDSVSSPPLYFADPSYYHRVRAFGLWSLPSGRSESLRWLEGQLDRAVDFYRQEIENRHWYGIYDYGDVMHTYDAFRHIWRYDIGGYAWQNTELMPTMWLWLAFLRTGRGDILTMAEAMTRHASDVDTYHLGGLKGLGTRHGIRHWGCPCKEIRIGMAGHYRYHYFLLCDRRMEDIFDDAENADYALLDMDPLRYVYREGKGSFPTHARSGPDWSAMVSNWMTRFERFLDSGCLEKIRIGMRDIEASPLGLVSGPDFEYDPFSGHLGYIGESATGGTHLQIALGGPQIWMELAEMLEDEEWKRQIAEYGRFYYLTPGEQLRESGGLTEGRRFQYPVMAAAMAAYGARFFQDKSLAEKTVQYLFRALIPGTDTEGFTPVYADHCGNLRKLPEIPWISTNFTAQWCLNAIMVLELIPEAVPETLEGVLRLLKDFPEEGLVRNC